MKLMNQKSFTVIELLVVIALIGLIASLVLVTTRGTSEKARIAKTLEFSQSVQHALGAEAVGIWNFDEGSGTTAGDISGYRRNGTISSGSWTDETPQKVVGTGAGKYALSFNGVDGCVSVSNFPQLLDSKTIVGWAFELSRPSEGTNIAATTDCGWGTGGYCFGIRATDGRLKFRIADGTNVEEKIGSISLPLNKWNFVAAAYNSINHTVTFYVNGKKDGPYQYTLLSHTSGANLYLGGEDCTGNEWGINGIIDEIRIYSTALTLGEIQKHYAEGAARHGIALVK